MAKLPPPAIYHLLGFVLSGDMGPYTFYRNKNKKTIFFLKAPPTEPPTYPQIKQRNRWSNAAIAWSALTPNSRQKWNDAARLASTKITGYNLFLYWIVTNDRKAIATIEHQSDIQLIDA